MGSNVDGLGNSGCSAGTTLGTAPTVRVFEQQREERFRALASCAPDILAVSPFITFDAAQLLLAGADLRNIKVVTRFNLEDFVVGVSQLMALEFLLKAGARVRGRKGLHSKLYIFGSESLIVTSANLTYGGLRRNLEFGLEIHDHGIAREARKYFDPLWDVAENDLTASMVSDWKAEVDLERSRRGHKRGANGQMPDYGAELAPPGPESGPLTIIRQLASAGSGIPAPKTYIKSFGTGEDRWDAQRRVRDALKRSESHYAGTYPRNKRPRRIRHGDTMYMAFMTKNPVGYAIFGRAWAIPYQDGRDDATPEEIRRQEWKKTWPHYIRVFDPVFLEGKLSDCVWLAPIIEQLGPRVFATTARNLQVGHGNLDPKRSLRQKADVELTQEAADLLASQFDERLAELGAVPPDFLDRLPKPDIQLSAGT